ncbi:MAG TPA: sigma 54-interacting transcriptional regulator [Bryobacteraceae bacterium]|nr:sigma 54-interacting transcriptional regulator [Bryobacteraceae bacterium]
MAARILIVEDERITGEDLRDILSGLGYEVVDMVGSGAEAIARAEQMSPDLALMDIRIKGDIDGTETARILRSRFNIPVIYLTAHADTETLERAKVAQPLGYITKPFQEGELHASIEMALHKHAEDLKTRDRGELLESTLRAIGQGVISVDRAGAITLLNPAAGAWTGWTADEARGRPVDEVFALGGDGGKATMSLLERVLADRTVEELPADAQLQSRDGGQRIVGGSVAPIIDHQGEVSGAVIVFGAAVGSTPEAEEQEAGKRADDRDTVGAGDVRVIAASPRMKQVLHFARRVAESEASTILIEGESGAGKDVVAKYMHHVGNRRTGPFVSLNCAAIPETLLESELFGYEKGAFTDARAPKAGILEVASGGTIFLDEIGEMPVVLQAKMLRVLEDQKFRRLGGVRDIQVDLRVMAATNRTLVEAIDQGKFRLDLYYRLNVIQVWLPPLRERTEDILPLARHFVRMYNTRFHRQIHGLSRAAEEALVAYDWPGNVRELRNMMERAMILEETDWIRTTSLQMERRQDRPAAPGVAAASPQPPTGSTLEQTERAMLVNALETANWNQTRAAVLLGISRDALRYKMKKFSLSRNAEGEGEARTETA